MAFVINYYQPQLKPFLGSKPYQLAPNLRQRYYHSWEDALWELLRQKQVPKGATILFPNFYCMDVLENVKKHGHQWQMYELDEHFQITPENFLDALQKHQPAIIIIFHACGITSNLMKQTEWTNKIKANTVIIEDCVHRLVNPENINLMHPSHIIMDSLRKVSPIPGSFVYGTKEFVNYQPTLHTRSLYSLSSKLLFTIFRTTIKTADYLNSAKLAQFAHDTILKAHDDIIGNSWQSHPGNQSTLKHHQYIDFKKVEEKKREQVQLYNTLLEPLFSTSQKIYKITISQEDYGNLHVFPIGFYKPADQKLIKSLLRKNISVLFKFPDCPWSKDKSVLFLPLGFHITENDIRKIISEIENRLL